LNAILTLINERLFTRARKSPGSFADPVGASNELPEEEELTALYDRFLVRFVVNYIAEDFRFLRMLESQRRHTNVAEVERLRELQEHVRKCCHPVPRYRTIADIRRELNKSIQASDRRYRQSLSLLQARAYLKGNKKYSKRPVLPGTCSVA
jgi:MoxR-like ATPase